MGFLGTRYLTAAGRKTMEQKSGRDNFRDTDETRTESKVKTNISYFQIMLKKYQHLLKNAKFSVLSFV